MFFNICVVTLYQGWSSRAPELSIFNGAKAAALICLCCGAGVGAMKKQLVLALNGEKLDQNEPSIFDPPPEKNTLNFLIP